MLFELMEVEVQYQKKKKKKKFKSFYHKKLELLEMI